VAPSAPRRGRAIAPGTKSSGMTSACFHLDAFGAEPERADARDAVATKAVRHTRAPRYFRPRER
jgi:hypothetical protein